MYHDHMPNYRVSVQGTFTPELTWSFATRVQSASSMASVAATWNNAWSAAWTDATNGLEQFYPTTTNMTATRVATLDGTMHETQNQVTPNLRPGTATGDTLPYLNSIVVSQRSTFSKRYNRGRFYLPAMEETFVNGNILIPAAQTKIKAAVLSVFNAITAGGNTVFVTSLKPHKDGTGQYQITVIDLWEVSNKPARQARRVKKQVASYV